MAREINNTEPDKAKAYVPLSNDSDGSTFNQHSQDANHSCSEEKLGKQDKAISRESHEAVCAALEKQHVHNVYHQMAHHFKDVRFKAWPRVKQFLLELDPGSLVADVGCGNGKYLHINNQVVKLGSDQCNRLVNIADGKGHEAMVADNLNLPYRDNSFDAVISIAVIHHFTTAKRRAQAIKELARILRPGGKVMIYVWAMEQKHRKFKSQDVLVPWHFKAKTPSRDKGSKSCAPKESSAYISSKDTSPSSPEDCQKPCIAKPKKPLPAQANHIHARGTSSDGTEPSSIPRTIKAKLLKLIGSKDSVESPVDAKQSPEKGDNRGLFGDVITEQGGVSQITRPVLEHSLSASEIEGFAIREFPMSSRPKVLSKQASWEPASSNVMTNSINATLSTSSTKCRHDNCCSVSSEWTDVSEGCSCSQVKKHNVKCVSSKNGAKPKVFKTANETTHSSTSILENGEQPGRDSAPLSDNPVGVLTTRKKCSEHTRFTVGRTSSLDESQCCKQPSIGESENEDEWMKNTKKAIQLMQSHVEQMGAADTRSKSRAKSAAPKKPPGAANDLSKAGAAANGVAGKPSSLRKKSRIFSDTSSVSSMSSVSSDTDLSDMEDIGGVCDFGCKPREAPPRSAAAPGEPLPVKQLVKTEAGLGTTSKNGKAHLNGHKSSITHEEDEAKSPECETEKGEELSKDSSKRFYHVFKEEELDDIIRKNVECLHIINSFYDHANWCVIAEKVNVWTV